MIRNARKSMAALYMALLWAAALLCAIEPVIAVGSRLGASANRDSIQRFVRQHEEIRLDAADAARQIRENRSLRLATPTLQFDLHLEPVDVEVPPLPG